MPDSSTLYAFVAAVVALLLIPGPAVIYILNRSVADGRRVGLAAVAGLEVGDLIQASFAAVGLSAVLAASPSLFNIVKWAGVTYLVVTGVRTVMRVPAPLDADNLRTSTRLAFRQGIIVNALNPKTALFFLSIFPQFIDANAEHATIQAFILGAIFVALATLFNGSYSLMASGLRDMLLKGSVLPFIRRYVSGLMFIGLGVLAAMTGHSSS